jgi:hypothetical protein
MALPSNRTTWSITCSGESATTTNPAKAAINTVPLTAANLVAQSALLDTLEAAIETVTAGVVARRDSAIAKFINSGSPSGVANRGSKWILTSHDTNGKVVTNTIPASLDSTAVTGTIVADLTVDPWLSFKNAWDAVATSPAGLALVLKSATLGGRRA